MTDLGDALSGPGSSPSVEPASGLDASHSIPIANERKRGSVEILCREIGFQFSPGMESPRLLVAFVRTLVLEVAEMRDMGEQIKGILRPDGPSDGSGELLDKTLDMLNSGDIAAMVEQCGDLHDLAHRLNPEDAYPTDHLIDMLSSCISGIRFGCEPERWGVGSRHAAAAAQHIWGRKYGVRLFDRHTPRWQSDWALHKLQEALVMLAFPPTMGGNECAAQGIEAGTAETRSGSVHESPVAESDAPITT